MSGINKVIIVGRLGTDPETKQVGANGGTVTRLNIATSETWVDREGQKQERTEWHKVSAWGKLAEICGKHLSKGRQVYVEGRLQTRSWEDQQGQKRYATEIVAQTVQFLGGPSERSSEGGGARGGFERSNSSQSSAPDIGGFQDFAPEPSFDASDDIPF